MVAEGKGTERGEWGVGGGGKRTMTCSESGH